MVITRAQLLELDAEQITTLFQCTSDHDNDQISRLLAGYDESCEIDDSQIPQDIKDAFIV